MADIRCPMCGKPNPEGNDECQHCGSRLKPLLVAGQPEQPQGSAPPAVPAQQSPPASSGDVTLLRRALRERGEPPEEEAAPPSASSGDVTLMRRALRNMDEPPVTNEPGEPEPEAPAAEPKEPRPEADETPAWLQRLRAQTGAGVQGDARKTPSRPEPPPAAQPPPAETGRRRTTGEIFRSLRTVALQHSADLDDADEEATEPPAAAPAGDDTPDWLDALRRQSAAQPEAEPVEPPPPPPPEPAAGMPDWLRSLREHAVPEEAAAQPPGPTQEEPAPAAEAGPQDETLVAGLAPGPAHDDSLDWLRQVEPSGEAESPAWPPLPAEASPAEPADDFPDWLKTLTPPAAEAPPAEPPGETPAAEEPAEAPDWLSTFEAPAGEAPAAEEPGEGPSWLSTFETPAGEASPAAEPGDVPDWLRALGAAGPGEPAGQPPEEAAPPRETPAGVPDWLQSFEDVSPAAEIPAGQAALPDWLDNLPPPQIGAPAEVAPAGEAEAPAEPAEPAAMPDWLRSLAPEMPATSTQTTPFAQPEAGADYLIEPPLEEAVPAEAGGPEAAQAAEVEGAEPSIEASAEVPDWLAAMRSVEAEPDVAAPEAPKTPPTTSVPPFIADETAEHPLAGAVPPGDLERATLPAWLEAMRPLPVAQPASTTSPDYEETTGPLAGMKGVIAAEPAIALPTLRLSAVAQPAVSETHLAQARLIQALVKEETAPRPASRRAGARPFVALLERWLIFAVLAIAVAAPFILEGSTPLFGPPSLFPAETVAARDVAANLPADRPVLVAFEYEPGAAGEMDLLAGALLDHLAGRGLRIVAVSTRPLGPALAQSALERSLPPQAGEAARDRYVNLGYLPGGVMALPVFAADPRSLVAADFSGETPDPELPPPDVWQSPVLFNVHSLADFGLIAVVSNSPESVRAWIEQAAVLRRGAAGGVAGPLHPPMIALVSASAEPLVQPYFLAEDVASSLQGLVSGQFGATDYALLAGSAGGPDVQPSPNVAAWRWDAQALGLLAAVVIIAAGGLIFGSFSLLRRREERRS